MNIAQIMIPKVSTAFLHEKDSVRQGMEIMFRHRYTAVPVLNAEDKYVGSVTEGDFLRHVMSVGITDVKEHEKYYIGDLVRRDFCPALEITADSADVVSTALEQNFVPIVDGRSYLCGIITRRGVILALANSANTKFYG